MTFSVTISTPSGDKITRKYEPKRFDDILFMEAAFSQLHAAAVEQEDEFHDKVDEGLAAWKDE